MHIPHLLHIADKILHSVELLRGNEPAHHIHHISPTPLLMTVAENDVLTPTDIALEAYTRAREPKQLQMLPGGHFDGEFSLVERGKTAANNARLLSRIYRSQL